MELVDKKTLYKKSANKLIASFFILLIITLLLCSGLIVLVWFYSDMPSAILATVILILLAIGISYLSIVELTYKIRLKHYLLKDELDKALKLAKSYQDVPTLRSYKEKKMVDLATLYLKTNCDEYAFNATYKKIKLESNILVNLCFPHILYLVNHQHFEIAYNEFLAFKLKGNDSYFINLQKEILQTLFDVIHHKVGIEELNKYKDYIDNKYFDLVISNLDINKNR